jgi:multiple sugar transport system substrate-binding protein
VPLNRRSFLSLSLLSTAGLLAACDTSPSARGGGGPSGASSGSLSFWSHSPNLEPLNKRTIEKFAAMPDGVPVQYVYQQTAKMGQALQLAKQSGQLPDVTTNVGLGLPAPALIEAGWFAPMQLIDEALAYVGKDNLVEGIHTFDGEVYSFPAFSTKQYFTVNWFNKELVEKAGLDPDNPPETYDDFRAACRAVQKTGDGISGWIANLGQKGRLKEQINYLAQGAGFEGVDGVEFRPGEVAFHSEPYVTAIEYLLSLQQDGLLMPGSINLIDNDARARWATGTVGYFFDGTWCTGVAQEQFPEFLDKIGSGPMIRPSRSRPTSVYRAPQTGLVWVTATSENPAAAGRFCSLMASPDYAEGIADGMGQPPADLSAVDRVDVHPAYKQAMAWFQEDCFVAPVAIAKNKDVAAVLAEEKPVAPALPDIVQGAFSGDVTDVRGALKQLSDKVAAERERAIKVAQSQGADVDLDDFAFPNWKPRTDYRADSYDA